MYKALNTGTGGQVALKIIVSKSETEALEVLKEAKALQAVTNKHTVKINTAFNVELGGQFLSLIDMPLVKGGSLEDLFKSNQLAVRDILKAIRHILNGLSGVHTGGIIHRDIKPANILVDGGNFLLGDFGLAQSSNASLKNLPAYTRHHPPELNQFHSLYDPNVYPSEKYDIYATGMTLFRLLLPKNKYAIDQRLFSEWMKNSKNKTLPDFIGYPAYIPRKLKKIIQKATALDRDERYSTATEMLKVVERLNVEINWSLPPTLPKWVSAMEVDKIHMVEIKKTRKATEFKYSLNGRKNRKYPSVTGTLEECQKALLKTVQKSMLQ